MNFKRLTYPTTTVITLDEAKAHLRVTTTDEDSLIMDCVRQATNLIELETNQVFLSGSCVYYLDTNEFTSYKEVKIWAYPINEITAIKYLDINGIEQIFSTTNYSVDISDSPIRILPTTTPTCKANTLNTIRIYCNLGYNNIDNIDSELIGWIKIFTAFFYQTRQPEYTGYTVSEIAIKYKDALSKHRKDAIV